MYVDQVIKNGTKLDCADLAIEIWIRFGEKYQVPVSFCMWDAKNRKHITFNNSDFPSTSEFVRFAQIYLGAQGLIGNTYHVPGGYKTAVPSDVFLWQFYGPKTEKVHKWGHTQIFHEVVRRKGHSPRIKVAQGSLDKEGKPTLVEFKERRVSNFDPWRKEAIKRTVGQRQVWHYRKLVGFGPRRLKSFSHLQ
jgi:hypothetical protein